MGLGVRFYLFVEDGLQRISHRLMEGLAHGKDAMPQFAGTKQKVANVLVAMEAGKPVKVERADGSFLTFDENGEVHKDLIASGFAAMETYRALERAQRNPEPGKVVDLSPKLNREKWERENRWTLSKEDLDLIADDIWNRKRAGAPKVQRATGIAPKPPSMTWEAKEAVKEIQSKVWSIGGQLERLAEPSLKGVSFEALQMAKADQNSPLWRAVSETAELRREILKRHRTGAGIWHATVEILRWDVTHHSGESVSSFHEKCNSKKEAEEAARRMLAENAKHFSAEFSVEASVVCELEWYEAASDDLQPGS
ncbi:MULTISPECIES: hypothetical protein [Bradyrhizobium]|jgi:LmbE family N-acetylglucosaminyl deacetylase|uniref:Uncharacterized protein n=2 Tax=Bradyrhizobium TaxID=374 RepID=A0ABY0Q6U0_9BRAD|nr:MULTISPECIES: hypothetical protein [Bradyrhizobium]SDJ62158.1 hypothetical protein SAMN05444163_5946 [Bradyrhizobium ottawaense]SEC35175.1 hypothetical protein SAMN05444171_1211 [Bradyrhizobium lablabi]SHK61399.1 hypothetical protein SAMN05444321_0050 [Bradyrhizobium lablabi]